VVLNWAAFLCRRWGPRCRQEKLRSSEPFSDGIGGSKGRHSVELQSNSELLILSTLACVSNDAVIDFVYEKQMP